jgi:hypothetical protein
MTAGAFTAGIALLLVLGGCQWGQAGPDTRVARTVPAYPQDVAEGPAVDAVVVRSGSRIRVINRTPQAFENVELWLNGRYVARVDSIDIGVNIELSLHDFRNAFGESYPTGSFLRPDQSQRLVLAEVFDPRGGVRHKFTVQPPGTR